MFRPFRTLGLIADGSAWSVHRRGSETFVTLSVGHGWQTFNCTKLQLVLVGQQLSGRIRSLASARDLTYAATGHKIAIFKRTHSVGLWDAHGNKILFLLTFGHYLLSVDVAGQVYVWIISEAGDHEALRTPVGGFTLRPNFTPTCITHPETYLNKVLIGSEEGSLQLWNISTGNLVFEFKGWQTPVRCCVASPALDVVGIGCGDGRLQLHNLKYNETVVSFLHSARGSVTAVSFRTDGQPFVAAGGTSGVITIWNLYKQEVHTEIRDAHNGAIVGLHYLANEPVLLSVGMDNAVKMWMCESVEARLLCARNGHSAPPTCISYYGAERLILSAGRDRAFRVFSTIQDHQSKELSQRHVSSRAKKLGLKEEELKLPPIVSFAAAAIRELEWCNAVSCHDDCNVAFCWRLRNFVLAEHVLTPSFQPATAVKACAISACGSFAVVGTAAGGIERFNMQSGLSRGFYQDGDELRSNAHEGAVTGLACDAANIHLISCGLDAYIKVWDFRVQSLKFSINVGSPLLKLSHHRKSGLVAVASDDMVIRCFDVMALRLVRQFTGHLDRITDLSISEDGKWLVSSGMDSTLRIWDIVGSKQVDVFHMDAAVTALSISPGMDMLATTHVNQNGIRLWVNHLMYAGTFGVGQQGNGVFHVALRGPSVLTTQEGSVKGVVPAISSSLASLSSTTKTDGSLPVLASMQLEPKLVTMAILPRHQWLGLTNLEYIKDRNKPTVPSRRGKGAPFFLPSLPVVLDDPKLLMRTPGVNPPDSGVSKAVDSDLRWPQRRKRIRHMFRFKELLLKCAKQQSYGRLVTYMRTLAPPAVDFELKLLNGGATCVDESGIETDELSATLDFFMRELTANSNFQLMQAWIQLFLKIHGESISQNILLRDKARTLLALQASVWMKVDELLQNVKCIVGFVALECKS